MKPMVFIIQNILNYFKEACYLTKIKTEKRTIVTIAKHIPTKILLTKSHSSAENN